MRLVLTIVAALEALEAILNLPLIVDRPNLLFGPWAEVPETALGIFLAKALVVCHPMLAIAALTFSITGRVRGALVALGAISILTWLSFLPTVVQNGPPLQGFGDIQWTVAQLLIFPLLAGTAVALAALKCRYSLATAMIVVPTAYNTFGMILFVIKVLAANV